MSRAFPYRGDSNVGLGLVRSKYGARPVVHDGIRFASTIEGQRYLELKLLERAGKIVKLELQPRFPLTVQSNCGGPPRDLGTYIADFRYLDVNLPIDRNVVVEEVKGYDQPLGRLKRKLAEVLYGIDIRVIRKGKSR